MKPKKHKMNLKSSGCCLIAIGHLAIILGLTLIMLQATIMSFIAGEILNLKDPDSSIYKMWQKYPNKVPYSMTFFNWTNHEDFFNRSVKPRFEEIGPYSFLQEIERVDIVRNHNNNTITFKQLHNFQYDNNLSTNGNLSDRLITINYFTMLAGHLIKDWHEAIKDAYSEYIAMLDPNYYFDTVIDNEIMKGNNNLFIELSNYFDFILPDFPRTDGFGWGKFKNGDKNFNGVYNIANGVNRQYDVLNWNYNDETPYFNKSCNKVKGSMGDVFSYPLNKKFINIFSPEICRYLTLYFEEEVVVDGILGYKYSLTKMSLDNGTLNPDNKCFCAEPCARSGVIDVSTCQFKLNGYLSLPHFYNADPSYLDPIEGLNPVKEKHESYVIVEPNSLLCLEFKISAQINLLLYSVEGISHFENYPKIYFPIISMHLYAKIPDELKKYLNMYLYIPYVIIVTTFILITVGIYVICYGVIKLKKFCSLKRSQNNNNQTLMETIPLK